MKTRIRLLLSVFAVVIVLVPATATASASRVLAVEAHTGAASLRADASCHDPCDDPFRLKARLKDSSGIGVKGVTVTFKFKLASGTVKGHGHTNAKGYAHFHQRLTPAVAPGGVYVKVLVTARHDGETRTATTWFRPDYR